MFIEVFSPPLYTGPRTAQTIETIYDPTLQHKAVAARRPLEGGAPAVRCAGPPPRGEGCERAQGRLGRSLLSKEGADRAHPRRGRLGLISHTRV